MSKPTLLKAFEENKGVAKYYIDKHPVNFNHPDSLSQVIRSLNELKRAPEDKISGLFRVKAGDPLKKDWSDSLYLLPQFMEADVKSSGSTKSMKPVFMNYNLMTGQMDYINVDGDTLQFSSKNVTQISFDDRLMYKQPTGGFVEVLMQGPETLVEMRRVRVIQQDNNPDELVFSKSLIDDETSDDRLCIMETSYFLIDRNGRTSVADKIDFIRAFPHAKKQINEYLNSNPVDFNNKKELIRLFSYCLQF